MKVRKEILNKLNEMVFVKTKEEGGPQTDEKKYQCLQCRNIHLSRQRNCIICGHKHVPPYHEPFNDMVGDEWDSHCDMAWTLHSLGWSLNEIVIEFKKIGWCRGIRTLKRMMQLDHVFK